MARWILIFATLLSPAFASAQAFHPAFLRAPPALKATYRETKFSVTNATNYNFTPVDFGIEYPNRVVLVGIVSRAGVASRDVSSVTIGGIVATPLIEIDHSVGSTNSVAAFYFARVLTGTTGDVLVIFNGTMLRTSIAVWTLENMRTNSVLQSLNLSTTDSGTIATEAGSCIFGVKYYIDSTTTAWTGLTRNFDERFDDGGVDSNTSGATACFTTAQASLAVTTTPAVTPTSNATVGLVISIR